MSSAPHLGTSPTGPDLDAGRGSFGELLRRFRREARMSQEALAEHAQLSVESIGALERGRRRAPYRDTIRTIADALALDAERRSALEAAARANFTRRIAATQAGHARPDAVPANGGRRSNLRPALSSFIGRESELAKIADLIAAHRLVTVTGSGGVGKTRTCVQVAATLQEVFSDGVWLIELAPLAAAEYIHSTIALTLGVPVAAGASAAQQIVRVLESQRALLIFDNCEHLRDPAAQAIALILEHCPGVKVLATSREALAIDGEVTFRMPSLETPGAAAIPQLTERAAVRFAAVALFVDRARSLDADFGLGVADAPIVADICRRLDGIPLAIELAAARVHVINVRELRRLLDNRLRVLTGSRRNALARHETLRALIDWSYNLLDDSERVLFRRLAIFSNSFKLEGAVALVDTAFDDRFDVLDVLTALVDKSLVLAEPHGDEMRFRLLETTRVYAREKLLAANEEAFAAARHLRYLRDCFHAVRVDSDRSARRAPLDDLLALELEDVRAALNTALLGADMALGGELLADIGSRWGSIGLDDEGVARVELFRAMLEDADAGLAARLAIAAAWLRQNSLAVSQALDVAAAAVALARDSGEDQILADALFAFALSAAGHRRFADADAALEEAEAIVDVPTATRLRLIAGRAFLCSKQKDLVAAAQAYEQLRFEHRALQNAAWERAVTMTLAEVEYELGNCNRAIALVAEVLPALRAHSDRGTFLNALTNFAGYLAATGDVDGARAAAREVIEESRKYDPEAVLVAVAIEHLVLVLARGVDAERACRLAGYVDSVYRRHGYEREYTERTSWDASRTLLAAKLSPAQQMRLAREGAALGSAAAIRLALAP